MLRRLPRDQTILQPAGETTSSLREPHCRLGDSEFHDGFGWNFDFLLCLWIDARTRLPLLLHQFAKTGRNEFAVLFDRFVREVAERIEEYSSDFSGFSMLFPKFGFDCGSGPW